MKKCTRCKEYKSLENFHRDSSKKDKLADRCKSCNTLYSRENGYKRIYGITKEIYNEMYINQEGKCLICRNWFPVLCVDHNHNTKKVRSLLCRHCNYNLGRYKESREIFQNFVNYIDTYI